MKTVIVFFFCHLSFSFIQAQQDSQELPYHQIPEYPESYTAENVAARMIDGLGFRYYWVTEGLRPADLEFKPNEDARTSLETLDHILGLSRTIYLSVAQQPITNREEGDIIDFDKMRIMTLEYLKNASDLLISGNVKLEDCKIVFQRPDRSSEYPFWNNINGPIADAIWHTGQIVSFRRSSGNPFNSKVSLFAGKLRE